LNLTLVAFQYMAQTHKDILPYTSEAVLVYLL